MPVLEFHLAEGSCSDAQCERLLVESSRLYAEVLNSPIERVRVFIQLYRPALMATAGVPLSRGGAAAPLFYFLAMQGRPLEERQRLLAGFTDLLVEITGAERARVRGGCWLIPPEDWGIGGLPATQLRAAEIRARADAASTN